MPGYFFNTRIGDELIDDPEGEELRNPDRAWEVARAMIRMAAEINGHVAKAIPDAAANSYQVTCWTCHRGSQHPQHAPEAAKPPGQ